MANIVSTREYVDGGRILRAQIQDDGHVLFDVRQADENPAAWRPTAGVSSTILRQLADLAEQKTGA